MKNAAVSLWAGLLVISMIAAWATWTREEAAATQSDVVALDIKPDDIQRIELDTPKKHVLLERKGSGEQARYWVTSTKKPKVDAPESKPAKEEKTDGGVPDSGTAESQPAEKKPEKPEEPKKPEVKRFKGNESAHKLLEKLAPLKALRALDAASVGEEKLEDFGLKTPEKTLVLQTSGGERKFEVGGTPYGSGNVYLRDVGQQKIFIVRSTLISDLEFSEGRLMDRRLHTFDIKEATKAVVTAGGKTRELVKGGEGEDGKAFWADAATPEEKNELYGGWLGKAVKLYVSQFLGEEKAEVLTTPVVEITWFKGSEQIGKLELQAEEKAEGKPEYRARSENTEEWVRLSRYMAQEVANDVSNVLGE